MENIDFEKIRKNTNFLYSHFFDEKIHISTDMYSAHFEEIEALKKSIEVLKSSEYSKPSFEKMILSVSAPMFWNDLYLLEYYKKGKESIINSIEKEQIKFDNHPDKEDILIKHNFETWVKDKLGKINEIDNNIILTNEFRNLLNKEFPNLENDFAELLQKHNDLQIIEAQRIEERDKQRTKDREEKQRLIENNVKAKPAKLIKSLSNLPTIDTTKFDAKWIFDRYINVVFECSEECFNSWLKDGIQYPETIKFKLAGRKGKDGKPTLAKAQLRKFIETITGDTENTKDAYYKTVFGLEIKTAQIDTSTNLNATFKDLKKKIDELRLKK